MRDLKHHLKYVQKKVIKSTRDQEVDQLDPDEHRKFMQASKIGQEIKNRRAGKKRRI